VRSPRLDRLVLRAIGVYRSRRRHGGRCVFTPSCSEYAIEAVSMRGAFVGSAMTVRRLLRCNAKNLGVVDYPSPRRSDVSR
jgi:uncharacterized protein